MKTCLYKPVFVNPQAYFVFPQLYDMQPKTDNFVEQAIFTGRLIITDLTNNQYTSYQNVNTIDFSQYADKRIKIEQYTDTGAVVLGEWIISQDTTGVKPIASYRAYDKTNDDEDRAVMKDLTGNGHDIQLYNFAFAESSGYGKYIKVNIGGGISLTSAKVTLYKNYKVIITRTMNEGEEKSAFYEYRIPVGSYVPETKVKITGLSNSGIILVRHSSFANNNESDYIKEDGIYTLNAVDNTQGTYILYPSLKFYDGYSLDCNIIIEQIPDYKGALVSDGVDDYGLCENFPILTKEKGYTVCALRKRFLNSSGTYKGSLVSKNNSYSLYDGAFMVEGAYKAFGNVVYIACSSFGASNTVEQSDSIFISQTKQKYDSQEINLGSKSDSNKLALFKLDINSNIFFASYALYALEIYDRDLTDEEIATVKARMIAEYEEKTGNKYEEETI